jgi:hypothetical protein
MVKIQTLQVGQIFKFTYDGITKAYEVKQIDESQELVLATQPTISGISMFDFDDEVMLVTGHQAFVIQTGCVD